MDDARPWRHDAEVTQGRLGPAQELVALLVALVLALHVEGEGPGAAEAVDLDAVVDDEAGGHERVDACRVAAERGHGIAHGRQVDDGWDTREVLEQHTPRHEGDLALGGRGRAGRPGRQRGHVFGVGLTGGAASKHILKEDLDGEGQMGQSVADRIEPVDDDVVTARLQRRAG